MFKFYDSRNKNRLRKLKQRALQAEDETTALATLTTNLQSVLQRINDTGSIKDDYAKKRDKIMMSPEEFEKLVLK